MRNRPLSAVPLLVSVLVLAAGLGGCGLFQRRPLVLCTDRAEIASFVEHFNALENDLRVVVRYREKPGTVLRSGEGIDLVVGTWLAGVAEARALEPLDDLFRAGRLERGSFYAPVLATGAPERRQVALPLSFCLPAVVFLPYSLRETVPSLSISLEYLREYGAQYDQSVRDALVRQGFSPLWEPSCLYLAAELGGARFREVGSGILDWDAKALEVAVAALRDWVGTAGSGFQRASVFTARYLYLPPSRLLDEKRIQFYLLPSCQLLRVLDEQKEEADFRWLSGQQAGQERILVADDILYVGVPRSSRRKGQAKRFLLWLFQEETQKQLLAIGRRKRLGTFGIAGGFSSLKAVNEREFPQIYPRLIGRIPSEELLYAAGPLPENWGEIKNQVLIPWLRDAVTSLTPPADTDLAARLRASRLGRPRR